jgi:hypothetical protein
MNKTIISSTSIHITEKDVRDFNKALMAMVTKLQDENETLKAKLEHLEKLLLSTNIPNL